MRRDDTLLPVLEEITRKDPRYKIEGYLFLLASLHHTQSGLRKPRHVTGGELLDGIRSYALNQFGPLSRTVIEHWGITETVDFGHIVFNLVEKGILHQTDEDTLEDFRGVYKFEEAFDRGWKEALKK